MYQLTKSKWLLALFLNGVVCTNESPMQKKKKNLIKHVVKFNININISLISLVKIMKQMQVKSM